MTKRITVKKEGVLLEKSQLPFENKAVLNPGVIKEGSIVHLFYRAVSKDNHSTIGYCRLEGPLKVVFRSTFPLLTSEQPCEQQGLEDPRIVKIDNAYYLTYTAYDGVNALGALAISEDLKTWRKCSIIVPEIDYSTFHFKTKKTNLNKKYGRFNDYSGLISVKEQPLLIWDKNLIFYPRRIHNKLYFLHRIKPDIQIVEGINQLNELTKDFWENYLQDIENNILIAPRNPHEICYVGGGCPPIETSEGWIIIYHGVSDSINGYIYSVCAAIFEIDDPKKERARLPYQLFEPDLSWEVTGEVNNVCFPTGTALFDDTLYIYYGAADERIAVASVSLSLLIKEILLYPTNNAE
jgi:predicted GH43/DUF377 family glycosyl hydrolase